MSDFPFYPNTDSRRAERIAELRARGFDRLADRYERPSEEALALLSLPHEPEPAPRVPIRRRWFVLAALFLALGFAGVYAQASHASPCYEDMPCFVWSQDGNGQRGVILRSAPAHCTWEARQDGCITVVSVRRYCRLRRAHRIDLARTAHLKGDGYARDHGCDHA